MVNKKFLFTLMFLVIKMNCAKEAFIVVPVADLVGQQMKNIDPIADTTLRYKTIPLSKEEGYWACPRINQAIFNEKVDVLNEENDEVEISIKNTFYQNIEHIDPQTRYWTLKENIIYVEDLEKNNIDLKLFPEPIDFNNQESVNSTNTVTLKMPFKDSTNITYSAGTRFIYKEKNQDNYIVYIFDKNSMSFKQEQIPQEICIEVNNLSNEEKIKELILLLKTWINLKKNIPFVWGGCSFTDSLESNDFYLKEDVNSEGKKISYWVIKNYEQNPKSGFDSSGLLLRASQICGIPYFYKNTTTAGRFLNELNENEVLRNGDLIFLPGSGFFIISDIENNSIIAARGYQTGDGKVVEHKLNEIFKNVETFNDLLINYKEDKSLLTISGKEFKQFKLLKFNSCWNYLTNNQEQSRQHRHAALVLVKLKHYLAKIYQLVSQT